MVVREEVNTERRVSRVCCLAHERANAPWEAIPYLVFSNGRRKVEVKFGYVEPQRLGSCWVEIV